MASDARGKRVRWARLIGVNLLTPDRLGVAE
jgi:hypothetical protein